MNNYIYDNPYENNHVKNVRQFILNINNGLDYGDIFKYKLDFQKFFFDILLTSLEPLSSYSFDINHVKPELRDKAFDPEKECHSLLLSLAKQFAVSDHQDNFEDSFDRFILLLQRFYSNDSVLDHIRANIIFEEFYRNLNNEDIKDVSTSSFFKAYNKDNIVEESLYREIKNCSVNFEVFKENLSLEDIENSIFYAKKNKKICDELCKIQDPRFFPVMTSHILRIEELLLSISELLETERVIKNSDESVKSKLDEFSQIVLDTKTILETPKAQLRKSKYQKLMSNHPSLLGFES